MSLEIELSSVKFNYLDKENKIKKKKIISSLIKSKFVLISPFFQLKKKCKMILAFRILSDNAKKKKTPATAANQITGIPEILPAHRQYQSAVLYLSCVRSL